MNLYHTFEILLVAAIVGACSVSVARRYAPGLREWLHPTPASDAANNGANCGSNSCNGCSPNGKSASH